MENPNAGEKRVAFVTGASFGIGAATALALARDGFDLAISATRVENVAATRASLEAAGARVHATALDIRVPEQITEVFAQVVERLGRVDVLVNNAGVPLRRMAVDIAPDEWENIMKVNVSGTFFMSQAMARHLIARQRPGCIVNIGSTHGIVGMAERLGYGVSKAAAAHMAKMLAVEWAPHRIRVNAIAPGRVDSNSPARAATAGNTEYLAKMRSRIPLGRFCTVDDCAEAVRYLASPEADYITGHTLVLDGGVTIY
jgi:NAD(P)-dependent dehydrogenase (short-subunit alcohol dehydrogenase family)